MPAVLSKDFLGKILGREWSFGYNCYEVGHTWTPSCTDAALEVSTAAALRILPLYAGLYTFFQVAVQRKYDLPASWDTLKSIARSSFFIFFHAYNGSVLGCALRRGFGRFYYRVLVCAPALLSSYLSLQIEKPARRQALAFYMLNLASEIVFRMATTKGYFKPIRNGETLLFASSLAAWYYFLKKHGFGHDPVSAVVKVLIGRDEAKSRSKSIKSEQQVRHASDSCKTPMIISGQIKYPSEQVAGDGGVKSRKITKLQFNSHFLSHLRSNYENFLQFLGQKLVPGGCHSSCPHQEQHSTCLSYIITPLASRFLLGYLIQSCLGLASKPMQLMLDPLQALGESFFSLQSMKFGLFLASLVSSGRATSCLLRHYSQSNQPHWHGLVTGFVAGLSMLWSPKASLSMYIMWKAVEQYYLLAAQRPATRLNQCHPMTVSTIYACSAATILYTFALEPRFVRPSYMKFLDNLSNHRLHQLNRMVLDVFGTGSSIGYEDYFPDLDPKYMSNQFKELVFNWMIQPYE